MVETGEMSSLKRKIDVMKSPTSLIRFRNAVGVMLALSAIFAVVISSVTLTQDRAFGQTVTDPITVSLETPEAVAEDTGTVTVTVNFSAIPDPATVASIPLVMGAEGDTAAKADDYTDATEATNVSVSTTTTDGVDTFTGTFSINLMQDSVAEPVETFTVSIGEFAADAGFVASATDSSVTITVTDAGDNQQASGNVQVTIPGVDGDEMPIDVDVDTNTRVEVGDILTAGTSAIDDPDHDDPATTGADEDEGTTVGADFPEGFTYSWQVDDNDAATDNEVVGTDKTFSPSEDEVGDTLILVVTWTDKYGNGDDEADDLTEFPSSIGPVVYDEARPFIIKGATPLKPDVVLTQDPSGMCNAAGNVIDADGMEVDGNTTNDDPNVTPDTLSCTDPKRSHNHMAP